MTTRNNTKIWTPERLTKLAKFYSITEDWNVLLEEFPFANKQSIQRAGTKILGLRKPKIIRPIRKHNSQLFDKYNQKSLYILGYLEADGSFKWSDQSVQVAFATSFNDIKYLEYLKNIIGSDAKTTIKNHHNINGKHYQSSSFTVTSRQWRNHLKTKCRIKQVPKDIPAHLIHHYIRGYFDGDGSIYLENSRKHVSFVFSNLEFAQSFHNIIVQNIGFSKGMKIYKKAKAKCWYFRIARQELVSKLGTWMYNYATIYLSRKKDRFALPRKEG